MPEIQIPKELQKEMEEANAKQNKMESLDDLQIDAAVDAAESEPMEKMKAWKGEIPGKQNEEDKPGLMNKINKAGKWIRGAFAAGAVMVGSEAMAGDRQAEMQGAHQDAMAHLEKVSYQRRSERSNEDKRIDDLKKSIVQVIESRFPGAGPRALKECDDILRELGDSDLITKINSLDEFGKKVLANKGEVKKEKKYSNDWKGGADRRADQVQEHMDRVRDAFKILFDKKIPYEKALAALEKEIEPGTQAQLNRLTYERKQDGTIYIQGVKLTQESRAQMAK